MEEHGSPQKDSNGRDGHPEEGTTEVMVILRREHHVHVHCK
jgi:hypothetical protein